MAVKPALLLQNEIAMDVQTVLDLLRKYPEDLQFPNEIRKPNPKKRQATMRSRAGTEEPEVGVAEGSAGVGEEVEEDNAVDAEAGVGEGGVEGCSGSDVIAVSSPLRRRRGGPGWAARAGRGRRP